MWRSLIPVANVDVDATSCINLDPGTHIPGASLMCTFKLAREGDPAIAVIDNVPCLDTTWKNTNAPLFAGVPIVADDHPVVGNYYIDNLSSFVGSNL